MWGCSRINVFGRVYLRLLMLNVLLWTILGDELFECRCNVSHLRSSKIDVSTFEDRRSMCRPLRIDDTRCVDLRRWMIDVPTFEDRWSLYRPSKTDDRCKIMLLHLLKTLMVYIVVCELRRGFALQCFHYIYFHLYHYMQL